MMKSWPLGLRSSESDEPLEAAIHDAIARKLIIVALVDGRIDTIYRARAVLANMTAAARMLPAFQELGAQSRLTFLDLAHMLGFKKITISNGRDFAHQVIIE